MGIKETNGTLAGQMLQEAKLGSGVYIGGIAGVLLLCFFAYQTMNALRFRADMADGLSALQQGRNKAAEVAFAAAIELNRNAEQAYLYKAMAEARLDERGAALRDYNRAIAISPRDAQAYVGRAALYSKSGDYRQAIADTDVALKYDVNNLDIYRVRAAAFAKSGQYEQAIKDATAYLANSRQLDSARAAVLADRCLAFFQLKQYDKAIADCTEAIKLAPENGDLRLSRALAYKADGDWQHAIEDCTAAAGLLHGDAAVYKLRALCLERTGQADDARKDWQWARSLKPSDPEPAAHLEGAAQQSPVSSSRTGAH